MDFYLSYQNAVLPGITWSFQSLSKTILSYLLITSGWMIYFNWYMNQLKSLRLIYNLYISQYISIRILNKKRHIWNQTYRNNKTEKYNNEDESYIYAQDCLERNILNIQEYTFICLSSFSEHFSEISLAKSLETNEISQNQFRGL